MWNSSSPKPRTGAQRLRRLWVVLPALAALSALACKAETKSQTSQLQTASATAIQPTTAAAVQPTSAAATSTHPVAATTTSETTRSADAAASASARIAERWGIEIQAIRLSANGYMLDFRYRVLDAAKAAQLSDRKATAYLIDQASGAKMAVPSPPKIGPMRTLKQIEAGRTYFIFFANPGKFIKPGNKVTVVVGDFRAENLIVE